MTNIQKQNDTNDHCNLCRFNCNVNRKQDLGVCKCGLNPKIALANLHMWEEPCISGTNGSGTVFFSGCNLKCEFCQNYKISHENFGKEITEKRLAQIFIELQEKNAHNINLVSPTPYVKNIISAIKLAKESGLRIPIIYNTNSYENIETIKMLNGYIDVYLPDLKYYDNATSLEYSKAPNYWETATAAISEMINQVGNPKFDNEGMITSGVIIRHLALPNHLTETKKILEWIKENLPKDIYVSVMAQYFPTYKSKQIEKINRKLSNREYSLICKMAQDLEFGYIQDLENFEEEYVPDFNLDGV